jgi:hypothetical protein
MSASGSGIDLEQKQREEARWRILRVLDAGRPIAVSENIIFRVLDDVRLPLGPTGVRRELDYLRNLGLATVDEADSEVWYAKLTAAGVDIVEYTVPPPPGITRPKKYW